MMKTISGMKKKPTHFKELIAEGLKPALWLAVTTQPQTTSPKIVKNILRLPYGSLHMTSQLLCAAYASLVDTEGEKCVYQ